MPEQLKHTFPRVAARFVAGRPIDGRHRTNATWRYWATKDMTHHGRSARWHHRPGYHRTFVRMFCFLSMCGIAYGYYVNREPTEILSCMFVASLILFTIVRMITRVMHNRRTITPLSRALSPILGVTPHNVDVQVKPKWFDAVSGSQVGMLAVPDHFEAADEQKRRIQNLFSSRLGIDLTFAWKMSQWPFTLRVMRAAVPPSKVLWTDYIEYIRACPKDKVYLGQDVNNDPYYGDLAHEDPHWAVNAGTRRGKTRFLMAIAVQIIHQGGFVTGIDPKRRSFDPITGVPGFKVFHDPGNVAEMWKGIQDFRKMMDQRIAEYTTDMTTPYPRALLIMDEINQFSAISKDYWDSIRQPGERSVPPIWRDLAAIAWQGAQFNCHIMCVGQRLDAQALGGQGLRDSFGIRALCGFTPQQYMFLIGLLPVQRSQKGKGRFLMYDGGELNWIQVVLGNDEELRSYAMEPVLTAAMSDENAEENVG